MIKRILVPLDGSKLAECALPYAEELATRLGAEVALISVTDRVQGYWPMEEPGKSGATMMPVGVCSMEEQAAKYLDLAAKKLETGGINVFREVVCGKVPEEIVTYANAHQSDLIIMSSHGRSGPSRWTRGSVAEKTLAGAKIPVMIIRAPGCEVS